MSHIIGLGIDATDIHRIAETIERYGDRFLHRIFTEGEVAYAMRRRTPAIHLAGRFAAKEAAMKALGTGWGEGVGWRDIEVLRLPTGLPSLRFHGRALERLTALGAHRAHLSLTHSRDLALAHVVLEGK